MILQITDVIDAATVRALQDILVDAGVWVDGGETANGRAKTVKNNEQLALGSPESRGAIKKIKNAVLSDVSVKAAARPEKIARLLISRYRDGMSYGAHVDAPYIDGERTDVSFTLFLSDPNDYDGGELVIDSAGAEDSIKLPAGALVLYPATSVHRVSPVTRGVRLAAVGWIKSRIRSAHQRAMVLELDRAIADLSEIGGPPSLQDRLANLRNNLLREFGD